MALRRRRPVGAFATPLTLLGDGGAAAGMDAGMERRRRRARSRSAFSTAEIVASAFSPFPRTGNIVSQVIVEDSELLPEDLIESLRIQFEGKIVSEEEMLQAADWMRQWYNDYDYDLNDVAVGHTPDTKDSRLVFTAHERRLMNVNFTHTTAGGKVLDGPGRVNDKVLMQVLGLKIGDHFRLPNTRWQPLSSYNLFKDIRLVLTEMDDRAVHLTVEIDEEPCVALTGTALLGGSMGPFGKLMIRDRNFGGVGNQLQFTTTGNLKADHRYQIDYVNCRMDQKHRRFGISSAALQAQGKAPLVGGRAWYRRQLSDNLALRVEIAEEQAEAENKYTDLGKIAAGFIHESGRVYESGEGHRIELRWRDFAMWRADSPKLWHQLGLHGVKFQPVLGGRLGIVTGGDIVHGFRSPKNKEKLRRSVWEIGSLRDTGVPLDLENRTWLRAFVEARAPLTKDATAVAFADAEEEAHGKILKTAGIGLKLLQTFTLAFTANSSGEFSAKVLPVDRLIR